jgi:hypothetical protein
MEKYHDIYERKMAELKTNWKVGYLPIPSIHTLCQISVGRR